MATEPKVRQSIFPDLPRSRSVVDHNGEFTSHWHLGMSSLFQALQRNFTNEGIQIPQLSDDDMNNILAVYKPALIGKRLTDTNPPTKNNNGKKAFNYTTNEEKTFIITFTTPGDATSTIADAAWKTVTLT